MTDDRFGTYAAFNRAVLDELEYDQVVLPALSELILRLRACGLQSDVVTDEEFTLEVLRILADLLQGGIEQAQRQRAWREQDQRRRAANDQQARERDQIARAIPCPYCQSEPGEPCMNHGVTSHVKANLHPVRYLAAKGALDAACPYCEAMPGQLCERMTAIGRATSDDVHMDRRRAAGLLAR